MFWRAPYRARTTATPTFQLPFRVAIVTTMSSLEILMERFTEDEGHVTEWDGSSEDDSSSGSDSESNTTSSESGRSDTSDDGSSGENSLNEDYSFDFVEEPPRDIFCPVKLDVMLSPSQTRCCGNHVSLSAARRLKRMRKRCPLCKKTPLRFVGDKYFQRVVLGTKVYCSKKGLGCSWVGEIRDLKGHLSSQRDQPGRCGFVEVGCPYSCGSRLLRREMEHHKSNECPNRPFSCPHCGYVATFETVTQDHWPECESFPLQCPNSCSSDNIQRRSLKRHLREYCPEEEVDCELSYAGCNTRVKRCRLTQHMEQGTLEHLSSLAKYTLQLHLHTSSTLYQSREIVFQSFKWHKRVNTEWYSPPFYTGVGGYKMCLGVDANGFQPSPSTHLGVAVYMMKGEFDNNLQWPFRGAMTLELVDHGTTWKNYSVNIVEESSHLDQDYEDIFSRVTEGERSEEGWGFTDFISHRHLYKPKRGRMYLSNDSLVFRVTNIRVSS